MTEKKTTIRDLILELGNAYNNLIKVISHVFKDVIQEYNDTLEQILDLPATRENLKLLKDFLNYKSK